MINFVCVQAGDYLGRGKEYVEKLYDMMIRNLPAGTEGRFVCFTDDVQSYHPNIEKRPLHGELAGWYNKLYLFKDGHFSDGDKIIFLDLDTVIVSGLDEIIKYDGQFSILQDFYKPDHLQSSVMIWQANTLDHVWQAFERAGYPTVIGGDQVLIERYIYLKPIIVDLLQTVYPDCFVSYKVSAQNAIPKNAKVVVFHGNPRPHAADGWAKRVWAFGGAGSLEMDMECNTTNQKLEDNIRYALTLSFSELGQMAPLAHKNAIFVGGGPSLGNLKIFIKQKLGDVFALNGAFKWLKERDIHPRYHVIADARPENAEFIEPSDDCTYLIASHCDKAVFDKLVGKNVIIWHRGHDGIKSIVDPDNTKFTAFIAGGSTVGMVALSLGYCLGYRDLHLFGYDSSYVADSGHAYVQRLNDNERVLDIEAYGRSFRSAPWMVQQITEYLELAPALIELGCLISTYGDGYLQHMTRIMIEASVPETDIAEKDGFYWPAADTECKQSIDFYIDDVDWIKSFCPNFQVAIQAGGNVGMWAKKLAEGFEVVYTFEPDATNFQCLVRNCPEPNIVKLQAGLGDEHLMIGLKTIKYNCGAHFVEGNGIYPVLRIDDLKLAACDLIQLDIEGFEYFALEGALTTIAKFKPVIVIELKALGEKYGIDDHQTITLLESLGYEKSGEKHRDVVFTPTKE